MHFLFTPGVMFALRQETLAHPFVHRLKTLQPLEDSMNGTRINVSIPILCFASRHPVGTVQGVGWKTLSLRKVLSR